MRRDAPVTEIGKSADILVEQLKKRTQNPVLAKQIRFPGPDALT
jgi:hypothetical protein